MARILVTGATGFIGRRLVRALVEAGHDVKAMTRHPETYHGPGRPVRGDVAERASLTEPLEDVDVAYYLVHSLDNTDFEKRDADAARMFAKVAATSRLLGSRCEDEEGAKLEDELTAAVNRLGVGPQGLGGDSTAFAVHVELAATHITMNPVAVNMQCHAIRRATATLTPAGVTFGR